MAKFIKADHRAHDDSPAVHSLMDEIESDEPMLDRSEHPLLTRWPGDAASLIVEMKRRAGVTTDRQLAGVVRRSPTAISHWKRNNSVPHEVLLEFDAALGAHRQDMTSAVILARAIAIRSAGFMMERALVRFGASVPRWPFFSTVAIGFHPVSEALARALLETLPSDVPIYQLGELLLADEDFLAECSDWVTALAELNILERRPISQAAILDLHAMVSAAFRRRSPQTPR